MTNNVPSDWGVSSLDDVLVFVLGGDWGKASDYDDEEFIEVFCIRGSEFKNWGKEKGKTSVLRKIKLASLKKRQLREGDLLIEISGGGPDQPVGRVVLIDNEVFEQFHKPVVYTNFLRLARSTDLLNSNYLNYYLKHFYINGSVINYQGGSNNLRNLKFKEYLTIEIPIPSLAEENAIAEKLDSLLAQVESTKTRLERIPEILKQFRQSVLAEAVSGRLTEDSRDEEGYCLTDLGFNIPKSWSLQTINDIACVKGGKRLPKGEKLLDIDTGYKYIRAGQLKNGTIINGASARNKQLYISSDVHEKIQRYIVCTGDVYITIVGASIGDAGIVPLEFSGANLTENAAKICEFKQPVCSDYVGYWLRSYYIQDLIQLEIKSGAQGKLALKRIKTLPFPKLPINEQEEIVRCVKELFAFANKIEAKAKKALENVNHLTQSILAQAFSGELTKDWRKQNPDLISGENSAEALLERIKAERAKLKPTRRKKKKA